MAVIQLKGLFLLFLFAIPGLHCRDSTETTLSKLDEKSDTTAEAYFHESTTVGDTRSTSPSKDRGTIPQETTTLPYFNVERGGCLQQSEAPASMENACLFCNQNGGTIVDLHVFSEHALTKNLGPKNITIWILFNCTDSTARCMTFYPYENVTCSDEYNYFCYHNLTNDEKCRIRQEETTYTDTSTTMLSSTATSGKTDQSPVSDEQTIDRSQLIFLAAGAILFMIVVVGIASFCFYRRYKRTKTSKVSVIQMEEVEKKTKETERE